MSDVYLGPLIGVSTAFVLAVLLLAGLIVLKVFRVQRRKRDARKARELLASVTAPEPVALPTAAAAVPVAAPPLKPAPEAVAAVTLPLDTTQRIAREQAKALHHGSLAPAQAAAPLALSREQQMLLVAARTQGYAHTAPAQQPGHDIAQQRQLQPRPSFDVGPCEEEADEGPEGVPWQLGREEGEEGVPSVGVAGGVIEEEEEEVLKPTFPAEADGEASGGDDKQPEHTTPLWETLPPLVPGGGSEAKRLVGEQNVVDEQEGASQQFAETWQHALHTRAAPELQAVVMPSPPIMEPLPGVTVPPAPTTAQTLRILSYNVRCDRDARPFTWKERAPFVIDAIRQADADVVCLQEARHAYAMDIAEQLGPQWRCTGVPRKARDEGTQILFSARPNVGASAVRLLDSVTCILSDEGPLACPPASACQGLSHFAGKRCKHVRIFTHTSFLLMRDAPASSRRLHVLNTHFPLEEYEQQVCAAQLVRYVREHVDPSESVVLCGDFNSHYPPETTGAPISILLTMFRDCHGKRDFPTYAEGFDGAALEPGTKAKTHRLDYIMLRAHEDDRLLHAEVLHPRYTARNGRKSRMSDHEPLQVEIAF